MIHFDSINAAWNGRVHHRGQLEYAMKSSCRERFLALLGMTTKLGTCHPEPSIKVSRVDYVRDLDLTATTIVIYQVAFVGALYCFDSLSNSSRAVLLLSSLCLSESLAASKVLNG